MFICLSIYVYTEEKKTMHIYNLRYLNAHIFIIILILFVFDISYHIRSENGWIILRKKIFSLNFRNLCPSIQPFLRVKTPVRVEMFETFLLSINFRSLLFFIFLIMISLCNIYVFYLRCACG